MPNIVNVLVSQQVASVPSTLQRTGAFVSQGGTTNAVGSVTLLTQASDLTGSITPAVANTSVSWDTGTVTVVCAGNHGIPTGDSVYVTVAGVTPVDYNGVFLATATNATTYTYPLATVSGITIAQGTTQVYAVAELVAMTNTFFAQGNTQAVYVLELGIGTPTDGVTALTAYIAEPLVKFYSYLLPASWDTEASAVVMANQFTGTTAQTYFYVTTTTATYSAWLGIKSVFAAVESPDAPMLEFSLAAMFWVTLSYNPNATNLAHPLEYSYIYAVTPYKTLTNAQQTLLTAAGVNWVGTGAQGGISNTLIQGGEFMDLAPFNYWYSVDWLSINVAIALSAAVINGSNNPTNPLYYNQAGINTLQKVSQATVNNGISFGLILSPATVDAITFVTYVAQHPSDYALGIYNGLSVTFIPARGFTSITIYLTASNIPV